MGRRALRAHSWERFQRRDVEILPHRAEALHRESEGDGISMMVEEMTDGRNYQSMSVVKQTGASSSSARYRDSRQGSASVRTALTPQAS